MVKKTHIMPFGTIGVVVYYMLKSGEHPFGENIESKIEGFLDTNKGKKESKFCGLPIINPEKANRNATIIVASYRYGKSIVRQLNELGFSHIIQAESFLTEQNTADALKQIQKDKVEQRYNLVSIEGSLKGLFVVSNDVADLAITKVEFVVTQRCTLKCRDCAALMQYYE